MKIVKTVSLELDTVVKIDAIISKGDYDNFSSFIQDAAAQKLETD